MKFKAEMRQKSVSKGRGRGQVNITNSKNLLVLKKISIVDGWDRRLTDHS